MIQSGSPLRAPLTLRSVFSTLHSKSKTLSDPSGVSGHETNNEGKKRIKGGPKGPELEIIGLSELKKKIKEIKKRKTGLYHRLGKRSRKKVEAEV